MKFRKVRECIFILQLIVDQTDQFWQFLLFFIFDCLPLKEAI